MKKVNQLKSITLVPLLLTLAACGTTPDVKETTTGQSIEVIPGQQQIPQESAWQKDYGVKQESTPNTLAKEAYKAETDVWQRVRKGFVMTPVLPLNKPTQKQLDRFLKNPKYLQTVTERARPYLHHIVTELDKRNMPMEIALLPVVESGFKTHVYSNSGAGGLWQFMPATGKVFGLQQNWWYDERRDIVSSTDAALTYLQKLYGYFGDWQLALAAYNAGEGTVGRAIKKNKKAGKDTDFWSLDLPKETTAYVPKLMAVSHLIFQPSQYGLTLRPLPNEPVFMTVDIGGQMDLNLAAKFADLSVDELAQFNPGYNQWATQPDGPHRLVIPVEKVDHFKRQLATLSAKDRMRWQRHKIKQGESLSVIARRYQTTVSVLKTANELRNSRIRAGRHLLIPIASDQKFAKAQQRSAKTGRIVAGKGKKVLHVVKAGDTWWDLARAYKVGVRQLTAWNGQHPHDTLSLGQKLRVWIPEQAKSDKVQTVNYQIKTGDSLWKISQQFNVSVAEVREWNGLSKRTLLKPGQMLTLYVDRAS